MIILNNRAVIYLAGNDRKTFLQGLITNDINKVSKKKAIYALMLTAQGRFLYDFFIIEFEDKLLIDCNKEKVDEIIKKLSIYKLRADVQIGKMDKEFEVSAIINKEEIANIREINDKDLVCFDDPRDKKMGIRIIAKAKKLAQLSNLSRQEITQYNHHRFNLKIADDSDLTYDQSLILEYGFDNLNAIDYDKGCYVGQEVTARTHYRGKVRKEIFLIEIANAKKTDKIEKNSEITCDNKKIGIVLSSNFYNNKLQALALIKNIDNQNNKIDFKNADLEVDSKKILL